MKNETEKIMPLYISYALDAFTWSLIWAFMPIYIFIKGASLVLIGAVCSIPSLVSMTASPLWGHLSDKIGKRKPFIILGLFTSGLLSLLYAVLRNPFHFLLATIFVTVFNAASLPTSYAFLSEHVEMKGEGVGKYGAYTSIGWFAGSLVGGFGAETIGLSFVFFIGFLSSLIGTFIVLVCLRETVIEHGYEMGEKSKVTFWQIFVRTQILALFFVVFFISFGTSTFSTYFSIYFIEGIKGTYILLGVSNAAATLASMVASLLLGKIADRVSRKLVILYSSFGYSALFLILPYIQNPYVVAALWAIPLYTGIYVGSVVITSDLTSEEERGRGMSIINSSMNLGRSFGAILGGVTGEILGLAKNLYIAALLNFVGGTISLLKLKETLNENKPALG
nr:MFS transporter [Candidatus Baldrarchaeota archaeon]